MRVGISFRPRPGLAFDADPLWLQVACLAAALRHVPQVRDVFLLDTGGEPGVLPAGLEAVTGSDVRLARPEDVTHTVDVVIEFGAPLPLEWMRRVRARGAKLVLVPATHVFASLAQNPVFGRSGDDVPTATPFDEVWMQPQHLHTGASLMRLLVRAPVHAIPCLWAPAALLAQIVRLRAGGHRFGFHTRRAFTEASSTGWRVGIFEPNRSVVRNATIPMLVCEQAFRNAPEAIETMMVVDSFHLKEHPSFNSLAANLEITRASRATYEPHLGFTEGMATQRLDAVVAHQWENALDPMYFEALHGGYPLVHNSPVLRDAGAGLHYDGFAAREGARVLLDAWRWDRARWQAYAAQADAFLRTLRPEHPRNVEAFARRLHVLEGLPA